MENDSSNSYFLLLEEYPQIRLCRLKFSKLVKVHEYKIDKKIKTEGEKKLSELRDLAKKMENIDGGLKPSENVYIAKIFLSGIIVDLKTGKTVQIPKNKINDIVSEYYGRKKIVLKMPLLPQVHKTKTSKSNVLKRFDFKLMKISRMKRSFN
ncbi:hypothetical protein SteCoe_18021 [Stentor coeruleus]|uniref:Uncharacterized protein n=1 Tax=Stentor coeruleus TaxID=5963 RepID=A0A1R2BXG6_9CILI|nr:hypothetical protein SteCoe_18021 [Stentor coeruleus]